MAMGHDQVIIGLHMTIARQYVHTTPDTVMTILWYIHVRTYACIIGMARLITLVHVCAAVLGLDSLSSTLLPHVLQSRTQLAP